jgi:hypothetical protein
MAQSYIDSLLRSNLLAVGVFNPGIAAFTGTGGTDVPAGTAAILVNTNSAFFNSSYTVDNGMYTGATVQAQVEILLHEPGHALVSSAFRQTTGMRRPAKPTTTWSTKTARKRYKEQGHGDSSYSDFSFLVFCFWR